MIERFSDGNMADVIRIGDVVRKQRGPWWDATSQVLNHLERIGYPWSPRVVKEHEAYVDLSFIAGESVPASLDGYLDESILRSMASRVRELHDALEGFRLDPETACVPWPVPPNQTTILCQNDLSPWNTVISHGVFKGFIDWDLVSYGSREWELAWVCWRWAPLYPIGTRTPFTVEDQVNRCRIILDAYGRDALDLTGFVGLIDRRMECALEVVEQLGAQGVAGFDRLLASGMHLSAHDDRAWLATHAHQFSVLDQSPQADDSCSAW